MADIEVDLRVKFGHVVLRYLI